MGKVKLGKRQNPRKKQWIIKRKICLIATQMKKNGDKKKNKKRKKMKTLNNSLATNNKKIRP